MDFEQIVKRLDFLEKQQRENKDTLGVLSERMASFESLGRCCIQTDQGSHQASSRITSRHQARGAIRIPGHQTTQ